MVCASITCMRIFTDVAYSCKVYWFEKGMHIFVREKVRCLYLILLITFYLKK